MNIRQLLIILGSLIVSSTAIARVGETLTTIEGRLNSEKVGLRLNTDFSEGYIARLASFYDFLNRQYPGFSHTVFYKSANKTVMPSISADFGVRKEGKEVAGPKRRRNGWILHIISLNNVSMIEAYYREGAGVTDVEKFVIMNLNSNGGKEWIEVTTGKVVRPKGKSVADEPQTNYVVETPDKPFRSAMGATHVLSDGSLRARVDGGTLMFFSSKVDESMATDMAADSLIGF